MTINSFQSDYEVDDYYNDYYNSYDSKNHAPSIVNSSNLYLTNAYSWKIIEEISDSRQRNSTKLRNELIENLKNLQYHRVLVKVDGVIHRLNRIQLALKSDYFEKLLTANFNEKESQFVEINSIDGRVFSSIIELINGKPLISVINTDNYVELLMAMDYLQMEIDLKDVRGLIIDNLKLPLKQNPSIFVLHDFITLQNTKFEYLLESVRGYLSIHLNELYHCQEYVSLSADQLVKIIARNQFPEYTKEKNRISRICAKWICHDTENRIPHIVDLANAARFRYNVCYKVRLENVNIPFQSSDCKPETKLALVEKYFIRLLNLDGEIDSALEKSESKTNRIINKIDETKKWAEFLKNEYFYDVTIKSGEKIFKLHRFMLASSSDYFARIFAAEISKATQSEKQSDCLVDKDTEYVLEDIDSTTFEFLIEFLYSGYILPVFLFGDLEMIRFLKAAVILKSAEAIASIQSKIVSLLKIHHKNIIKLMDFSYGNETFEEFYNTLRKYVITTWPEIINTPKFHSASIDVLESILTSEDLTTGEQDTMNICSKWIAHDVKNRFSFLTRISVAVNRSYMMNIEAFEIEIPKDWDSCSEQFIKDRLWEILRSNTLVPSKTNVKSGKSVEKPMFVAAKDQTLDILDANLEKIASIPLGHSSSEYKFQISATVIDDNLFIVYVTKKKSLFQVYNLSSKKLTRLSSDQRMQLKRKITLFNCNGQVYCCSDDGLILRYVVELNRWTTFSEIKSNEGIQLEFASNGNTLFKVPWLFNCTDSVIPEAYDFEKNSWISLPALPTDLWVDGLSATTVNGNLAILIPQYILLFDNQLESWHEISIPYPRSFHRFKIFTQYQEGMLFTRNEKIYYISASNGLPLEHKDLPNYNSYSELATVHVIYK